MATASPQSRDVPLPEIKIELVGESDWTDEGLDNLIFKNANKQEDESDTMSISSETSVRESTRFDTIEELSDAIDACKQAILETPENTRGRMEMVLRLIQLRIRFEDMKERANATITKLEKSTFYKGSFETRGHIFISYQDIKQYVPGVTSEKEIYCQQCGYEISVHLQSSQHCQDCGFSVHTVCLDNITRNCVALKIRTQANFIMEICPEKTLLSLKYRCAECNKKLQPKMQLAFGNIDIEENKHTGLRVFSTIMKCLSCCGIKLKSSGSGTTGIEENEPRLCDYTGLSYCGRCHWSSTSVIPARIIRNWDFEPCPVSQAAKQYLNLMIRKPIINIRDENPQLFSLVQELDHVSQLRKNIIAMKKYIVGCRIAKEQHVLHHLLTKQHFVDGHEFYSLEDLIDLNNGSLLTFVRNVIKEFKEHIYNCVLCLAKGFICEICEISDGESNRLSKRSGIVQMDVFFDSTEEWSATRVGGLAPNVIFPFGTNTSTCDKCASVYHRSCFTTSASCPKCIRIQIEEN